MLLYCLLVVFACMQVLGRPGPTEVAAGDKVDVGQFIQAWRPLGVSINSSHAAGLFNKYGQDIRGRLPVMVRRVR